MLPGWEATEAVSGLEGTGGIRVSFSICISRLTAHYLQEEWSIAIVGPVGLLLVVLVREMTLVLF